MTPTAWRLDAGHLPSSAAVLRDDVRAFLAEEQDAGAFEPKCDAWLGGFAAEFSARLGGRGWLGMTWPARFGGHERSALERFVVIEELLAAGAPVAAHWVADRQSGPAILRYGTEEQQASLLPGMARGECFFAIGMSEPDSGSDLASVRTRASPVAGGWVLNGTKVWTSQAHRSHFMITLVRSAPPSEDRHAGLSQFIVDLQSPGVSVRPIHLLTGEHHFNEVVLDDVFVPDGMVLGRPGDGWQQVTAELAYERSGPERFLSTMPLFTEFIRTVEGSDDRRVHAAIGELWATLWTLRRLSLAVAAALDAGQTPEAAAALVKDLGTRFETELIEVLRQVLATEPSLSPGSSPLARRLAEAVLHAPGFTLRGGTNEILRGIIARKLGLR